MKPKLSIIIPVFDEADRIVSCLSALAPMRMAGVEIIVADGGSRDATVQLASLQVDRVVVGARGRACQMNAGAAVAQGDAFLFLHTLTHLPDRAVNDLFAALASGAQWGRCDKNSGGQNFLLKTIAALISLRCRICGIALEEQAIFVQREAFIAIGGFPERTSTADLSTPDTLGNLWRVAGCGKQRMFLDRHRVKYGIWEAMS